MVDDDEDLLIWASYLLCMEGYQVQTARDSVECMAMLKTHHPDLVVMDLHLPGMSGFTTTQIIRSQEDMEDVPILIYSVTPEEKVRRSSERCGATEYVEKTGVPSDLLDRVKSMLSRVGKGMAPATVLVRAGS